MGIQKGTLYKDKDKLQHVKRVSVSLQPCEDREGRLDTMQTRPLNPCDVLMYCNISTWAWLCQNEKGKAQWRAETHLSSMQRKTYNTHLEVRVATTSKFARMRLNSALEPFQFRRPAASSSLGFSYSVFTRRRFRVLSRHGV